MVWIQERRDVVDDNIIKSWKRSKTIANQKIHLINELSQIEPTVEKNKKEALDIVAPHHAETKMILDYIFDKLYSSLVENKYKGNNWTNNFEDAMVEIPITISYRDIENSLKVSGPYYKDIIVFIHKFVRAFNLGRSDFLDGCTVQQIDICCYMGKLISAIAAYYSFVSSRLSEEEKEEMNKLFSGLDYTLDAVEDSVVDELHYKLYESTFLDKNIVKIINSVIKSIDDLTFMESATKRRFEGVINLVTATAAKNISKSEKFSSYSIVPEEQLNPLYSLVNEFVHLYNLGKISRGIGYRIYVELNCTLEQLINAYYMEKQRIGYLMGSTDPEPEGIQR